MIVCARWREVVDPDGAERRADKLHDRRHVILHHRSDGCLDFQSGLLDPVAAEAFLAELEHIERDLFEDDWAEAKERRGQGSSSVTSAAATPNAEPTPWWRWPTGPAPPRPTAGARARW